METKDLYVGMKVKSKYSGKTEIVASFPGIPEYDSRPLTSKDKGMLISSNFWVYTNGWEPVYKFKVGDKVRGKAGGWFICHPDKFQEDYKKYFPSERWDVGCDSAYTIKEMCTNEWGTWYKMEEHGNWVTEEGIELENEKPKETLIDVPKKVVGKNLAYYKQFIGRKVKLLKSYRSAEPVDTVVDVSTWSTSEGRYIFSLKSGIALPFTHDDALCPECVLLPINDDGAEVKVGGNGSLINGMVQPLTYRECYSDNYHETHYFGWSGGEERINEFQTPVIIGRPKKKKEIVVVNFKF